MLHPFQVDSPSIRYIMQEKIHMKLPGEDGSAGIKWHQDWAFLPHTNDSIVTVGLAVDDSTVENGKDPVSSCNVTVLKLI